MSGDPKPKPINPFEVAFISPNPTHGDIWAELQRDEREYEFLEELVDECRRASADVVTLKHEARDEILSR